MGACSSKDTVEPGFPGPIRFPTSAPEVYNESDDSDDEGPIRMRPRHNRELRSYIDDLQQKNYEQLVHTFKTDKQLFILNQLLLCVQFFQNFDQSLLLAKDFKRMKEHEVNEKLGKVTAEGVICGDRRVILVHGIPEILAKNFIYRPPKSESNQEENIYEALAMYTLKKKTKTATFMCESILPLDFVMNFDNYEVYTQQQYNQLKENDYSMSPSDSPIFRLCMEEADQDNKIPRGYVKLVYDSNSPSFRPDTVRVKDSSGTYSLAGDFENGDATSEAKSSIYASSPLFSDDEDTMSTRNMQPGQKLLHLISKRMSKSPEPPSSPIPLNSPQPRSSEEPSLAPVSHGLDSFKYEGILPVHYPGMKKTFPHISLAGIDETDTSSSARSSDMLPRIPPVDYPRDVGFFNSSLSPTLGQSSSGILKAPGSRKPYPAPREADTSDFSSRSATQSPEPPVSFTLPTVSVSSPTDNPSKHYHDLQDLSLVPRKSKFVVGHANASIAPEYLQEVRVEKDDEGFGDEESNDSDEDDDEDGDGSSSGDSHASDESEEDFVRITYLNSTQFAAATLTDFSLIASKVGIDNSALINAQVLNRVIRCMTSTKFPGSHNSEQKDFQMLHTFTPSLFSKHWPQNAIIWFNQRLLRPKFFHYADNNNAKPEELRWPSRNQVESIEALGCHLVPKGFHSHKEGRVNPDESMQWQVSFPQGESILLNALKHVHWRAYIYSALLFRAFLSPLGPCGIGLEHVRNIIYQMCEEDFMFWNDEEPGAQLKNILRNLYESLAHRKLPSFFIKRFDMMRETAPESTQKVQAYLSLVRENLIIYCIYAMRNLTCLHKKKDYYPAADLKQLYKLLICSDTELLFIMNPHLRGAAAPSPDLNNNRGKKKNKKNKRDDLLDNADEIEAQFESVLKQEQNNDKTRDKMRKKYDKYLKKKEQLEAEEARRKAAEEETLAIPIRERRKSIDLNEAPVNEFKPLRVVMIIEFFIKHFLSMAERAVTFRAFSEATMYTLHVENLCRLLRELRLQGTNMEASTIDNYLRQCSELRQKLGSKMAEYVRAKLSHLDLPDGTSALFMNQKTKGPKDSLLRHKQPPISSNFVLASRKLPTPPPGSRGAPSSVRSGSTRRFETADVGIVLPSFPDESPFSGANFEPPIHSEFALPADDNLLAPRRQSFNAGRFSNNGSTRNNNNNSRRHSLAEIGDPNLLNVAGMF